MDFKVITKQTINQINPISQTHSCNSEAVSNYSVWGKVKSGITCSIDFIKNKIANVTSFAQLVPLIVADSSDYDFKGLIGRFAGFELSEEEYRRLIQSIKKSSNPNNISLLNMIYSIRDEIKSEETQRMLARKQEEERISRLCMTKCHEFCADACLHLQNSISSIYTHKQYDECYRLYVDQYDSNLRSLCREFKNFIESSNDFRDNHHTPNNSNNQNSNPEEDKYILIARKYILLTNCITINTLRKFQSFSFGVRMIEKFSKDVAEITGKPIGGVLEIPAVTIGLFLLWGAMSIELLDAAYGDIDLTKNQLISASISIFSAMFIVALAREGIPPQLGIDIGITHCVQRSKQAVYAFFHDIAKPLVDFGVDYANVALEKCGFDSIITKNKTWNELLQEKVSTRINIAPISMGIALPMLHTFRVADAFLTSLKNGRNMFSGSLKENLLKLSPLPQNGEESKLVSLFWGNPYLNENVPNRGIPSYGLFFNYSQEVDMIYSRHTDGLVDDKDSFLCTAKYIYHDIRDLNYHIGKGNNKMFDDFLVYCIAGRLIDKHYKACLGNITQNQLAYEISHYIHMYPSHVMA